MTRLLVPTCALALAVWGAARPAAAQQPEADTLAPVALQPVVVTVLRTPYEFIRVPYAVAVNHQEQIQRAKPGLGLDEALRGIPGVQVDNRYNYALGERISIRGFGARAQFGVRGVRVMVDGIPATMPDGQTTLNHVDLGFLRRAEVIRGPASALYGNAAGGVVQLESELPPSAPLTQEVGVVAGSDGLLRAHATTGGTTGGVGYLFNIARLDYDGYREFSTAENLHINSRLGLEAAGGELRLLGSFVDYDAQNPGSLSEALLADDRSQAYANNVRQQTGEAGRHGQVGATWSRETGSGTLEVSGYALNRDLTNPIPPSIIDLERVAGGARTLFRADPYGAAALQWTVGIEGDLQRDDRLNFGNEEGERDALLLDQEERVDNAAAFLQLGATPLPNLTVLGGVRYDWFRFRADDRLISADNPDDSGSRTLDAWSPSLGINYELVEPLHLYANVSSSFETPTTTELANRPSGAGGFNPELDPQRTLSYEVGAKGRLAAWAAYQLALYHADIDDALIPFEVPDVPGRQFFRNAGSAVHQGVEVGTTLMPLHGLLLQLAYTYTDARFRDYMVDDVSFEDNEVPGVAPHRLDLGASYEAPAGWFASLDARTSAEVAVNDANEAFAPGYTVLDARFGVDAVRFGRVQLEPFVGVTNLLDEQYITAVTINAFGGRFYEPGPGRALYAGARVRLGVLPD